MLRHCELTLLLASSLSLSCVFPVFSVRSHWWPFSGLHHSSFPAFCCCYWGLTTFSLKSVDPTARPVWRLQLDRDEAVSLRTFSRQPLILLLWSFVVCLVNFAFCKSCFNYSVLTCPLFVCEMDLTGSVVHWNRTMKMTSWQSGWTSPVDKTSRRGGRVCCSTPWPLPSANTCSA